MSARRPAAALDPANRVAERSSPRRQALERHRAMLCPALARAYNAASKSRLVADADDIWFQFEGGPSDRGQAVLMRGPGEDVRGFLGVEPSGACGGWTFTVEAPPGHTVVRAGIAPDEHGKPRLHYLQ